MVVRVVRYSIGFGGCSSSVTALFTGVPYGRYCTVRRLLVRITFATRRACQPRGGRPSSRARQQTTRPHRPSRTPWLARSMLLLASASCALEPPTISLIQPPPPSPPPLVGAWTHTILVGTHHKTGTVLLSKMFRVAAKMIGVPRVRSNHSSTLSSACTDLLERQAPGICIIEHVSARDIMRWLPAHSVADATNIGSINGEARNSHHHLSHDAGSLSASSPSAMPFIHAVRDPLEMCVSAYQYHLLGAEPWLVQPMRDLNGSTLQQYYKTIGPAEGARFECKRMILELVETALVFNATRGLHSSLTLRLEDFSKDFDGTARHLFAFLGSGPSLTEALVNASAKYDLARGSTPEDARHVSAATSKQPLRDMVLSDTLLGKLMGDLRTLLNYHHANSKSISSDSRVSGDELCEQLRAICATTHVGFLQWCSYGRVIKGRVPSLASCGESAKGAAGTSGSAHG